MIFDRDFRLLTTVSKQMISLYLGPVEIEQCPDDIYSKLVSAMREAVSCAHIDPRQLAGIGIATQRGTYSFWNRNTGIHYSNFITWQDTRGVRSLDKLEKNSVLIEKYPDVMRKIRVMNGHRIATVLTVMTEDENVYRHASDDGFSFGTMDTWAMYKLSGQKIFATSASMASVHPFYSLEKNDWNLELLGCCKLEPDMMPAVMDDSDYYGMLEASILGVKIPICATAADQQAGLLGSGCLEYGMAKCTMGTGTFVNINIGDRPVVLTVSIPFSVGAQVKEQIICWRAIPVRRSLLGVVSRRVCL